ncbi:MAG: JAB domain-containing protein [Aureispira sp.]
MNIKLSKADKKILIAPKDIYSVMQKILLQATPIHQNKEHFWILGLANNNKLLFVELVSLGSVNKTIVEPMEVYSPAIRQRAVKIVLCHNHPSGSLKPSEEDCDITDRLIQVGRIVNIPVVDHLIISTTSYLSFVEVSLMKCLKKSIQYVPNYALAQIMAERTEIQIAKIKEEAQKNTRSTAAKLKKLGLTAKEIAECTNLTIREVRSLN